MRWVAHLRQGSRETSSLSPIGEDTSIGTTGTVIHGALVSDHSLVSKGQLIEVNGIGRLLRVAIFLVVDGDAVPAGCRCGTEGPVKRVGLSVERDGLIKQLVVGSSLHHKRKVIP